MDTKSPDIHKVLTFKSGNFVFSNRYDRQKVGEDLRVFHARYESISALPVLPSWAASLDAELIRKSIFSTAAIEGNPLEEDTVGEIIKRNGSLVNPQHFEREIINLKNAHAKYLEPARRQEPFLLSEDLIKEVHGVITATLFENNNSPGKYRNERVKVGNEEHGGTYIPPKILEDIKTLMAAFVAWINSKELLESDPLVRAALAHYHLGKIHPFRDGNGRTARMIEAMLLAAAGYRHVPEALWNQYYRNIHEYFIAFSLTEQHKEYSVQPFLDFFFRALDAAASSIQDPLFAASKALLFKNYAATLRSEQKKINQRQYDLIELLLEYHEAIEAHDLRNVMPLRLLYQAVSDRTITRDLKRLQDLGLLVKQKNKYRLNYDLMRLF